MEANNEQMMLVLGEENRQLRARNAELEKQLAAVQQGVPALNVSQETIDFLKESMEDCDDSARDVAISHDIEKILIAATHTTQQGLDAPWIHVSERLPELRQQVLAGYFYQDAWLKGKPWVFSVGVCSMYEEPKNPCFPQGKRWQTHGCSHNDISYWMPMPKFPELPAALAAQAKQGGV